MLRVGLLVCLVLSSGWMLSGHAMAQPSSEIDVQAYDLNMSKGLIRYNQGRDQEAEEYFRRALKANPTDPDAGYHLGQTQIKLEKYQAAEESFRRLLEINPSEHRARLGLGMAQYHLEHYADALNSLAEAEKTLPTEPLIYYYQGLAHNKQGTYEQAPQRFLRALALNPDLGPEVHYQSGVAYYKQGVLDEAKSEFQTVIELEPESELSRSAKELVLRMNEPGTTTSQKRWDLSFNVSAQYDSNVVLLPIGIQPPGGTTGISRKDDFVTALFTRGEYRVVQTDTWTVGTSYSFFQNFHSMLSSFDVQNHTPTVYVQRQIGAASLRLQYAFDYVSVGRDPYLMAHTIQPILTVPEGDDMYTVVQARYQSKDFQTDRFAINSTRDGKNWLIGAMQYFLFANHTGHVRVGYTFDADRTGGGSPAVATPGLPTNADWAYNGHRASLGINLPAFYTVKPDLAFDYYRQEYLNPNSFSANGTTVRRDNIYMFTGTLTRNLTENLWVAFQGTYMRDQANVGVFDYRRNLNSLSLGGQF
ncbi:MAG: hypothetical protein RL042_1041 [Nitrospirota bacterium]